MRRAGYRSCQPPASAQGAVRDLRRAVDRREVDDVPAISRTAVAGFILAASGLTVSSPSGANAVYTPVSSGNLIAQGKLKAMEISSSSRIKTFQNERGMPRIRYFSAREQHFRIPALDAAAHRCPAS